MPLGEGAKCSFVFENIPTLLTVAWNDPSHFLCLDLSDSYYQLFPKTKGPLAGMAVEVVYSTEEKMQGSRLYTNNPNCTFSLKAEVRNLAVKNTFKRLVRDI